MKRGFGISFAIILLLFATAYSQPEAETYTLDQCIDIALKNNYGVIAAENLYKDSKARALSAWADLVPTIEIASRAGQVWRGRFGYDVNSREFIAGSQNSYSAELNFRNTFQGLGLFEYENIKFSKNNKASWLYNYVKSQNDLVLEVKRGYYDLIKAKMLLDVSRDAVRRGEERLRVVQSRYDLGSASMSDVLKAKVQYGNDKLDLVSKTNAFKLAQANLAFIMGVDVNLEFGVEEDLPERNIVISYDEAISEALKDNPEYLKAKFDLAAANSEKNMALSYFLPSLTFTLQHSTSVNEFSRFGTFEKIDAEYLVFAGLSYYIFNSANDYARLKAAKNKVETNKENFKNTKNSVALEIKRSFLELDRAQEAKKLAEESVAAAQEDLNLVKEKYNLGAATILEVLDAEVSFKEAQTSHVNVLFDYNLAVSQLEKALGR